MMPSYVASNFVDTILFTLALFEQLEIQYVTHYGTLLGAVRLGGVAPWDEDADFCVFDWDFEPLHRRVAPLLAAHGFEAFIRPERDAMIVRQVPWVAGQGHIGISLWPGALPDHEDPAQQPWDVYMRHSELHPLRRYAFHGSYVPGPAQPEPVLERLYRETGSLAAMRRFKAPRTSRTRDAFWRRVRPIDGPLDWDAISTDFRARAASFPWHASTFPWWWFNGAYNIGVRAARKIGTTIERI